MSHLPIRKCDMTVGIGAINWRRYANEEAFLQYVRPGVHREANGPYVLAQVPEEEGEGYRRNGPCHLGNGKAALAQGVEIVEVKIHFQRKREVKN